MTTVNAASAPQIGNAEDYRAAIAALDASTRALEAMRDAARHLEPLKPDTTKRAQHTAKLKRSDQGQQQSRLINVLRTDIEYGHTTSTQAVQKAIASSLIDIDGSLVRHNHDFDLLEDDEYRSHSSSLRNSNQDRTQKLLHALRQTRGETIRTRLDRMYLEALPATTSHVNGHIEDCHSAAQTKAHLIKTDLKALHAEIDDVTELVVSHEHGDGLLTVTTALDEAHHILRGQQTRKAASNIATMKEQLQVMTEHAAMLHSHRIVLQRLADHLQHISAAQPANRPGGVEVQRNTSESTTHVQALQQYLGLVDGSAVRKTRLEGIDEAFDSFKSHLASNLAVHKDQVHTMPNPTATMYTVGDSGDVAGTSTQSSSLNDLNSEIAAVKARMDALTS